MKENIIIEKIAKKRPVINGKVYKLVKKVKSK